MWSLATYCTGHYCLQANMQNMEHTQHTVPSHICAHTHAHTQTHVDEHVTSPQTCSNTLNLGQHHAWVWWSVMAIQTHSAPMWMTSSTTYCWVVHVTWETAAAAQHKDSFIIVLLQDESTRSWLFNTYQLAYTLYSAAVSNLFCIRAHLKIWKVFVPLNII